MIVRDLTLRRPKAILHWRWNTLFDGSDFVLDIMMAREFWSTAPFRNLRDATMLNQVDRAMKRAAFVHELEFLAWLTGVLRGFMSWCQGCPCHEKERLSGETVKGCPMRGIRAPELAGKVESVVADLHQKASAVPSRWLQSLSMADAQYGFRDLAATIKDRFSFLDDLPYLFIRCRCRDVARRALDRYDSTPRDSHHRVTHRVLARDGEYRAHFEVRCRASYFRPALGSIGD